MVQLTFKSDKFHLRSSRPILNVPEGWHRTGSHTLITKNIQVAARFRSKADSTTENIFKKLMLREFQIPSGGVLSPKGKPLFPFQHNRGVPHILKHNRSYLAHEPGLGKSAQAICAVNTKPGRTLIVAPGSLTINWAREITKWFIQDFPSIAIIPETNKAFSMNWLADFIIVSDNMISKEWVLAGLLKQNFRFVFVDEAHRFKEITALRTVALYGGRLENFKSPGLIYKSEHVCTLSGTPILNKPIELWPNLYAMAPELIDFMPYQDFGFRYCGAKTNDRGNWLFMGSDNEEELNNRIMGRYMQRITKAEVLPELPDKIRKVVFIETDSRPEDIKRLDLELIGRLRKSNFEVPEELGDFATIRHLNGLAKVPWVAKRVMEYLTENPKEQIILFAHHRDVIEKLSTLFFPLKVMNRNRVGVIMGGMNSQDRTDIQDRFQAGECRLILGNIGAMNLGITLTAATRTCFLEYDWTPSNNEQAEDRAHRIGQKDSVFCEYFVLPNSIDEHILASVLVKQRDIEKVLRNYAK